MESHFSRFAVLKLVAFVVLTTALVLGQGIVTGSISGTVEDQKGAVVPGATIKATEISTNRDYSAVSTSSGAISLRLLPIGTYKVTIEAPNFQTYVANRVSVSVGKDTPLGVVQLNVGSRAETVTVEGSAPLVETTSNEISETFSTKQTANLPIGATYDSLALFVPGVATAGDASFSNNNGAEFSVNGQRARSNNFQLDGQNNNDNTIVVPSIFFGNQDVISEVQVVTNYSAEYGRNLGSTVNYTTKSGTNAFHGTAYEFNQNSAFDSLDNEEKNPLLGFCSKGQNPTTDGCTAPKVNKYIDNRFGGTIGGQIKKDKVWFFGSSNFERTRTAGGISSAAPNLTPTPTGIQQLQAAFPNSPGVNALSQIGPTAVTAGNPSFSGVTDVPVTANGVTVPIQMGVISRTVPSIFNDYEATGRVDFNLSEKDKFFARYIFQQQITTNFGFNGPAATAGGDFVDVPGRNQQIGLDYTHNFSGNLIDQMRFSYSRARSSFQGGAFPNCTVSNIAGCTPQITFSDGSTLGFGVNTVFPQGRLINVYQLQNNASWLRGKHTIKFGGEYDRQRSPNYGLFTISGTYDFPDFNSFIANTPDFVGITNGPLTLRLKENDLAFYVQDDWRVKKTLTLNLGLRWEYYGQAVNLLHDQSVKQQTGPNPLWDPTLPLSRTTVPSLPNHYKNFGPVVGFAWQPGGSGNTVVRGGFRIAYDFSYYNLGTNVGGGAPLVNAFTFTGALPGLPAGNAFAPGVQGALLPLLPHGDPGLDQQTTFSPDFKVPYSQQWTFGIQHQFNNRVAAEVRYVGNHTLHNFQETNGNPALGPLIASGFGSLIPAGLTPCADPSAPGNIPISFNGTTIPAGYVDCTKTNVVQYATTGYSIYHGMQTELRMKSWHNFTASAAYTWSKTIDNTSEAFSTGGYGGNALAYSQNPFDISRAERGISGYDFPHVVGVLVIYDFPMYKDQHGFLGHTLGGWEISNTYRYTSGQPYTVVQTLQNGQSLCDPTNFTGGSTRDACRPILGNPSAPMTAIGVCTDPTAPECGINTFNANGNPGVPTSLSAVHWVFNDINAAKFFGSPFLGNGRNTQRGQPISTANLAVYKNTKISERLTLQFQAQAFNIMNTQFLGVPSGRINSRAFSNVGFNTNGGNTFAGNIVTDGIGRRRLLFGLKMIF